MEKEEDDSVVEATIRGEDLTDESKADEGEEQASALEYSSLPSAALAFPSP